MFYLGMSIFGVIILVGLAIRRLPQLKHPRLGMEIAAPRPYIGSSSPVNQIWQRVQEFFAGMMQRREISIPKPSFGGARPGGFTPPQFTPPVRSTVMNADPEPVNEMPTTAHPGDFWQEELATPADPFELPTQGLITRRGEAQKIAHELVLHADEAFRKKDYKEAEKYYLQAATKDPENARIYNRLGVIYLQTKNYRDAVEAFRRAIKFDDRVASRHFNLALAYLGKRDYRSAERGLKEALRLEPTNEKYRKTLNALIKQST